MILFESKYEYSIGPPSMSSTINLTNSDLIFAKHHFWSPHTIDNTLNFIHFIVFFVSKLSIYFYFITVSKLWSLCLVLCFCMFK